MTANRAYRALRRIVAFRTLGAIEFRVLFADVEVAVFRTEFALAGARTAVTQVARVALREAIRMASTDCDRLYF